MQDLAALGVILLKMDITKVVSPAIKAKKPKTRYVAGKLAKPLMFLRKWVGDRLFDKIIMSQM